TLATSLARVAEWLEPAPPRPLPLAGIAESQSQLVRRVHRLMDSDVAAPVGGVWRARAASLGFVAMTALAVPGLGVAEWQSASDDTGRHVAETTDDEENAAHPAALDLEIGELEIRTQGLDVDTSVQVDTDGLELEIGTLEIDSIEIGTP